MGMTHYSGNHNSILMVYLNTEKIIFNLRVVDKCEDFLNSWNHHLYPEG